MGHSLDIQQIYEGSLILFLPPDDLQTLVGIVWDYRGAGIAWNVHRFIQQNCLQKQIKKIKMAKGKGEWQDLIDYWSGKWLSTNWGNA